MCGFEPQYSLLEKVGVLLISTLTSLKHAGAAFASRDTLQSVASVCMSSNCKNISALPELWANRLLEEISLDEKVRDSTLRRSTGYALGFLAIMRSEISSKYGSTKLICRNTLESILSFSLPPEDQVKFAFENLKLSGAIAAKPSELFYTSSFGRRRIFIPDSKYEVSRFTFIVFAGSTL